VKVLTTNVTGHFAYFGQEFSAGNYHLALNFLLFIGAFLSGSFVSNSIIEIISAKKSRHIYLIPMLIEVILLSLVAILGSKTAILSLNTLIAFTLLFAMGLQNALVTKASQAVVRTTHLTGLFTDLGIELSQYLFYSKTRNVRPLAKSIQLKLAIIICFFSGCVAGGFLYSKINFHTLFLSAIILIIALLYDSILFHFYHLKRKLGKSPFYKKEEFKR